MISGQEDNVPEIGVVSYDDRILRDDAPRVQAFDIHRTEASKTLSQPPSAALMSAWSAQISRVVRASAELSEHVTSDMLALFPRVPKVEPVET